MQESEQESEARRKCYRTQPLRSASALCRVLSLCGAFLLLPLSLRAQDSASSSGKVPTKIAMPADSATCAKLEADLSQALVSYASSHPEAMQKLQQQMQQVDEAALDKMSDKIDNLPDTVQASILAAVIRGQSDTARAIVQRALPSGSDPHAVQQLDAVFTILSSIPDTIRTAMVPMIMRCP